MKKETGLSTPIKLVIEDITYTYPEDKLFEKLENYLNYKIKVMYNDEEPKNYIIKGISLEEVPTLELE